jgi:hypothetical protein
MDSNMLTTIHTLLNFFLGWSCWCRLVKMSRHSTYYTIKFAFVAAAMASIVLLVAPWGAQLWSWFPAYQVHGAVVVMLFAFVAVQVATSYHWRRGVPRNFIKE